MSYTEWDERKELSKIVGNTHFDFKKIDEYMCLVVVHMMGNAYYEEDLELHHWYKSCTLVPDIVAYEIYNNL